MRPGAPRVSPTDGSSQPSNAMWATATVTTKTGRSTADVAEANAITVMSARAHQVPAEHRAHHQHPSGEIVAPTTRSGWADSLKLAATTREGDGGAESGVGAAPEAEGEHDEGRRERRAPDHVEGHLALVVDDLHPGAGTGAGRVAGAILDRYVHGFPWSSCAMRSRGSGSTPRGTPPRRRASRGPA